MKTKAQIKETEEMRNEINCKVEELKSLQLWIRDCQLNTGYAKKDRLNDFCDTLFNIYSGLEKI